MWASYTAWCRRYQWFILAAFVGVFGGMFGLCIVAISIPESDVEFAPFTEREIISASAFCAFEQVYGYNPRTVIFSDELGPRYGRAMRDIEAEVDVGKKTLREVYADTEAECGQGATQRLTSYFED